MWKYCVFVLLLAITRESSSLDLRNETLYYMICPKICWEKMIGQGKLFDVDCLFFIAIKAAGVAFLCFAFLVKAPQIIIIIVDKSTTGIIESNIITDLLGAAITVLYLIYKKSALTVYGDSLMNFVTTCVLLLVFWFYSKDRKYVIIKSVLIILGIASLYECDIGENIWNVLIMCVMPAVCIGRVQQIRQNYKSQSTGELSPYSLFLSGFGALGKLITLIVEIKENKMYLVGFSFLTILNLSLFIQYLVYRNTLAKTKTGNSRREKTD